MSPEPLTPAQVDALLRPDDPRTTAADLLVLRDALHRLSDAWSRIAEAAGELSQAAGALDRRNREARGDARGNALGNALGDGPVDGQRPRPTPPRAD